MPNQRLIKKLKQIAKELRINARFRKGPNYFGGGYYNDKKNILVIKSEDLIFMTSSFFHETAHVLDHREGLFKKFYKKRPKYNQLIKVALRAERHADARGKKLMRKYFPRLKYISGYNESW
jgi:hypothetical protein